MTSLKCMVDLKTTIYLQTQRAIQQQRRLRALVRLLCSCSMPRLLFLFRHPPTTNCVLRICTASTARPSIVHRPSSMSISISISPRSVLRFAAKVLLVLLCADSDCAFCVGPAGWTPAATAHGITRYDASGTAAGGPCARRTSCTFFLAPGPKRITKATQLPNLGSGFSQFTHAANPTQLPNLGSGFSKSRLLDFREA